MDGILNIHRRSCLIQYNGITPKSVMGRKLEIYSNIFTHITLSFRLTGYQSLDRTIKSLLTQFMGFRPENKINDYNKTSKLLLSLVKMLQFL